MIDLKNYKKNIFIYNLVQPVQPGVSHRTCYNDILLYCLMKLIKKHQNYHNTCTEIHIQKKNISFFFVIRWNCLCNFCCIGSMCHVLIVYSRVLQ